MAFNLIPKNDAYFEDFDRHIALVREMARILRSATEQKELPDDLWTKTKTLEHQADEIARRQLARLDESFVTPIEREDIHLLTVHIDDMADAIEHAASRFDMYDVHETTDEVRAIARGLDEMAEHLAHAIRELRTLKPSGIRDATAQVERIEERIDEIFRDAQKRLFARRPEAYDLVRWKEIYDLLETASDHGRHIARTVNHILVRHS